MADRPMTLQDVEWRELFAFTRIFRAFRVAVRPSKLLLALAALLCMYAGGRLLDYFWPTSQVDAGYKVRNNIELIFVDKVTPPFASFAHEQIETFKSVAHSVLGFDWSYPGGAPGMIVRMVLLTPLEYWRGNEVFFTILFAWFLVVWAIFGGAIARIAAIHVARDEVISLLPAIKFSLRAFPSFVAAPLIPFIMVLVLGLIVAVMGLVLYIPYAGPILTGILLIIPLILGIVMMLLTIGSIAGAGLMYPTIAVEGSDAFDGVSRALSHVFAAPWRLFFYSAVATAYGAVTYIFVRVCIFVMLWLVHFFVGWFLTGGADQTWKAMWAEPNLAKMAYSPNWESLNVAGDVGAAMTSFWVYLAMALLGAYVISFYFSASTIIYLLMRRKVDAAEMDQVYLEPADEELPETAAAATSKADETKEPASKPEGGESSTQAGGAESPEPPQV